MSDETEYDEALRMRARTKAAEAAADWLDQWEHTAGSVVTGYVLIAESIRPNGEPDCLWITGSGGPPDQHNLEPLPRWRVEGLVRQVLHDMSTGHVSGE